MVNKNLYNEDELNPPEWMDKSFFEKVLKNVEKKDFKIDEYIITPGTLKSDHYASVMFRIRVRYSVLGANGNVEEEKLQSLILKTLPYVEGLKKDAIKQMKTFETEIKMYTETLPRIESILRQHGDMTKLSAKLFYYNLEDPQCIVFEDLVELGYRSISGRWCSMAEVKQALLKLSKLHAVSYKLAKEGDASIKNFKDGSFSRVTNMKEFVFIRDAIKLFKESIAEENDLIGYTPHIERVEENLLERCEETFNEYDRIDRDGIFVLNHGDFHMKNMMIKTAEGELNDLMLVDYQISVFASAAIDLHYTFVMLMSPEMRLNHSDELLYFYITNFQETLKTISYPGRIPTVADFRKELDMHRHWQLYLFIAFLLLSYVLSDAEGDLAKTVEDESYRRKIFKNPMLLQELRDHLPRFLHRGYFEN